MKSAVKTRQVRMPATDFQHSSLDPGAFDVVIFKNNVLSQHFDGKIFVSVLQFGKYNLYTYKTGTTTIIIMFKSVLIYFNYK